MRKFAWIVIGLPLAAIVLVLAVINRHPVTLSLDPFSPEAPALSITLPLFMLLFAAVAIGVVLGGCLTWLGQGKWRRQARDQRKEAAKLRMQAERREHQAAAAQPAAAQPSLPPPGRSAA